MRQIILHMSNNLVTLNTLYHTFVNNNIVVMSTYNRMCHDYIPDSLSMHMGSDRFYFIRDEKYYIKKLAL
jgi:hypothetical protein